MVPAPQCMLQIIVPKCARRRERVRTYFGLLALAGWVQKGHEPVPAPMRDERAVGVHLVEVACVVACV